MGAFCRILSVFFLFTFICLAGAEITAPPAGKTPEVKPATSASDQQLLNNKFDKLQKVLSQEAEPGPNQAGERAYKPTNSKDVMVLTFKLMFYIAILSILLYFGIKAFKKGAYGKKFNKASHRSIEVLESAFIGQNKNISLVKVLDRVLVLGVTDRCVSLLTSIDDEPSLRKINENNRETASKVANNFSSTVNAFLSKFKKEDGNPKMKFPGDEMGEE